jgi:uncharacterized protein YbjT (DUF2867 family)
VGVGETILVTGATGNVGLAATLHLLANGRRVRAVVRDPEGARRRILDDRRNPLAVGSGGTGSHLELVRFDFLRDAAETSLFRGVDQVFLMRPPAIGDVKTFLFPFLATAQRAGVAHVVLLSLMGAGHMPFVPHRKLEKEILRLGLGHSFLRAGFFMQNLDTVFRDFVRYDDELPVPAGNGRTSFVDTRDVGEAASRLMLDGRRPSNAHVLTGSEALDYHQVAAILSEELGRRIVYTRPSLRAFKRRARAAGWDPGYARLVGRLFYTVRFGAAARTSEDLPRIIRRKPRTLRDYVRDYRAAWERNQG